MVIFGIASTSKKLLLQILLYIITIITFYEQRNIATFFTRNHKSVLINILYLDY